MEQHAVVLFENQVLVIIKIGNTLIDSEKLLDWYSKKYSIEREKLSMRWSHIVKYNP